jgi:hypothetical protein
MVTGAHPPGRLTVLPNLPCRVFRISPDRGDEKRRTCSSGLSRIYYFQYRNAALLADGRPQGESPREEDKMMSAEEVAGHILKATQQRKREIVLTTQGKLAVFLNKWIPGVMIRLYIIRWLRRKTHPSSN